MQSAFPKSLEILYGAGERLAQNVAQATDGRFQIQVFGAGEIIGPNQIADAVANRTVECGHTFSSYYVGKDPTFAFGTAIPFGLNPRQMNAWLAFEGDTLLSEFYSKHNVFSISTGNTGVQMGGWFRKPVLEVGDLNGLRFRTTGLGARILQKLGVVPQAIPSGDIYPALECGTIDAAEFTTPIDDEKLGFVKVAPYYHFPGWWDCGTNMNMFINLEHWNKLPSEYKHLLRQAGAEAGIWMQAAYDYRNPAALRRLVAAGAKLTTFPRPVLDASLAAAQETYAEICRENQLFKRLFESYAAFRKEELLWWQAGEYPYDSFMVQSRNRL